MLFAAACELVGHPVLRRAVGSRRPPPVYLFGAVMTAVLAFPLFWLLDTGSTPLVVLAMFLASHASRTPRCTRPQAAFLSELFGTRVRYSGASLGAQLSSVLAGGLSPLIATALLQLGYGRGALSLYLIGMAAITIVCRRSVATRDDGESGRPAIRASSDSRPAWPDTMKAAILERGARRAAHRGDSDSRAARPARCSSRCSACGVCHTDLHVMKAEVAFPTPAVMGHEISGTVAALGPGVAGPPVGTSGRLGVHHAVRVLPRRAAPAATISATTSSR